MIVSVVYWQLVYWVDYSWKEWCTDVYEMDDEEYAQLSATKVYFSDGTGDTVVYMGISDTFIEWSDFSYLVTDVDMDKVNLWYTVERDAASGDLSYISSSESDDAELAAKELEMNAVINKNYPYELRMDYMVKWVLDDTDNDFVDMITLLWDIKAEFLANGKDADFTEWE